LCGRLWSGSTQCDTNMARKSVATKCLESTKDYSWAMMLRTSKLVFLGS
jgi:hypothetical protein